jgi:predicted methyltransferase
VDWRILREVVLADNGRVGRRVGDDPDPPSPGLSRKDVSVRFLFPFRAFAVVFAITSSQNCLAAEHPVAPAIAAAIADPGRPTTDTARDANRKPVEVLSFAGLKPGDAVADYASGAGYFTRIFARVVGPQGHVYAVVPSELFTFPNIVKGIAETQVWAVGHPNVSVIFAPALQGVRYPEKLDLFWISQNYHDLHDPFMGPVDIAAFNKAVFAALKPGSMYIIADHAGRPGTGISESGTLHRVEEDFVRKEVEAAGFKMVERGDFLRNPADPRDKNVPDNGQAKDEFVLKFVRP